MNPKHARVSAQHLKTAAEQLIKAAEAKEKGEPHADDFVLFSANYHQHMKLARDAFTLALTEA